MKTVYETELQKLKDYDEVQCTEKVQGYDFIITAGHGYLVVPRDGSEKAVYAFGLCSYGFKGRHAIYLEEDCEAGDFLKKFGQVMENAI